MDSMSATANWSLKLQHQVDATPDIASALCARGASGRPLRAGGGPCPCMRGLRYPDLVRIVDCGGKEQGVQFLRMLSEHSPHRNELVAPDKPDRGLPKRRA
jgi:hypothetical protein